MRTFHIPDRRWKSKTIWRRSGSQIIHLDPGSPRPRRRTRKSSRKTRRVSTTRLIGGWRWSKNDFESISGNYTYRHHVEPRVKLYVPRQESFPIPLRYIDVTRATSTTLDVMLESRIDDYWNFEGDRDLSDTWTDFTRFTSTGEETPDRFSWSGRRLTKEANNIQARSLVAREMEHHVRCSATKRKTKVGYRKTEAWQR